MLKDITLGQYYPSESFLHKVDPRMKILSSLIYMAAVFTAKNLCAFGALLLFTVAVTVWAKIPLKIVLKAVKPLLFIMIFTALVNILWADGKTLLVEFWVFKIYLEGIIYAFLMVLRIALLLVGTSVILTYTTTPIDLTDGIERLLSPLKKIKLPVHEFAMMMTIALRFVPTLIEETEKIMNAQKARGADFSKGNLKERVGAIVPILIPLFVSSFRRADELSVAMECRCYRGGEGRTKMTVLKLHAADFACLAVFALCFALMFWLNSFGGVTI